MGGTSIRKPKMDVWVVMSSQGVAECVGLAKTRDEGVLMAVQSWGTKKKVNLENLYSVLKKKGFGVEHSDNVTEIYDNPDRRVTWDCIFVVQKMSID